MVRKDSSRNIPRGRSHQVEAGEQKGLDIAALQQDLLCQPPDILELTRLELDEPLECLNLGDSVLNLCLGRLEDGLTFLFVLLHELCESKGREEQI